MSRDVRFGLCLPQDVTDFGAVRDVAQAAEQLGYASLWLYDHFQPLLTQDHAPILEPWTLMSALAGATRAIRLGILVLCYAFRPPPLLAKMAASLDVLSGGRLEFGYGAGVHQKEFAAYGYEFPPIATRIRQMEEGLTVIKRLWSEPCASWSGRFYQLHEAICEPKPLQRPYPPVTLGGGGERLMLRAVARHADSWNYWPVALPEYERKCAALAAHCHALGRDPASLRRSLLTPTVTAEWEKEVRDQLDAAKARRELWALSGMLVQGTPDIVVPRYRDYMRRGVDCFIVRLPDSRDVRRIEFLAEHVMRELQ